MLAERASAVRLTHRLTDSPACLVSDGHGMSLHLERLLKASGQSVPASKPVLEINPHHPIVERLKRETDPSAGSPTGARSCSTRPCSPKAASSRIPPAFVKRLNKLTLALAGGPASKIWTPGGRAGASRH